MKKVIVASKNPVKIEATRLAFEKMFPKKNFLFEGISVSSGVSEQPQTQRETLQGAQNRVNNAQKMIPNAAYYVGIESGLESLEKNIGIANWIVIKSEEQLGYAKTGLFVLPPGLSNKIKQGKELGPASDEFFKKNNIKHQEGTIGVLTNNTITRTTYYTPAIMMALIPFKNKQLYI